jgi:ketosteroid isomerase-like protein
MTAALAWIILLLQPARLVSAPRAPEAVVQAMFAAFNRHDAAAMEQMYAEDARLTSSDFCHARGRSDIERTYNALFKTYPDIRDTVETIVSQGDRVAVRFTAASSSGGISMTIHTFLRVRDGRIVEDDSVFDAGGRPCEP